MRHRHISLRFLIVILSVAVQSCQSSPSRQITAVNHLTLHDEIYVRHLKNAYNKKPRDLPPATSVGFFLYDPETQTILDHQNEDVPYIPASTSKIPTAVSALKILGPGFRFKTIVAYTGFIRNQVLHGDLYLKGEGDPALSVAHLMSLAKSLSDHRIKRVTGNFYFDETEVISRERINTDSDVLAPFNVGLGALSMDFNHFYLNWRPNQQSKSTIDAFVTPDLPIYELALLKHEDGLQSNLSYENVGMKDRWMLSSPRAISGRERLPVKNASLITALLFSKFCKMNGVSLPLAQSGKLPSKNKKVLSTHQSASLVEIAERALEYSNNMMSELILVAAARKLKKKPISLVESSELISNWITSHVKTKSWESFRFLNGSGLTSENRITPRQLVAILTYANQNKFLNRGFESLLPVAGWKGTLETRLKTPETAFHVWAKTGTMSYGSALAGYLYTLSGKRLIFAIMVSDLTARAEMDQTVPVTSEKTEQKAAQWIRIARDIQDELIQTWIIHN